MAKSSGSTVAERKKLRKPVLLDANLAKLSGVQLRNVPTRQLAGFVERSEQTGARAGQGRTRARKASAELARRGVTGFKGGKT